MNEITRYEWECYREVQKGGLYNMFTPDAIRASGLDKKTYFIIVEHYDFFYKKFEGGKDE
tara:strand:+ start:1261 stop:1440 length:180 start_codon:yes stop_codon:yes gene_type:complete